MKHAEKMSAGKKNSHTTSFEWGKTMRKKMAQMKLNCYSDPFLRFRNDMALQCTHHSAAPFCCCCHTRNLSESSIKCIISRFQRQHSNADAVPQHRFYCACVPHNCMLPPNFCSQINCNVLTFDTAVNIVSLIAVGYFSVVCEGFFSCCARCFLLFS